MICLGVKEEQPIIHYMYLYMCMATDTCMPCSSHAAIAIVDTQDFNLRIRTVTTEGAVYKGTNWHTESIHP